MVIPTSVKNTWKFAIFCCVFVQNRLDAITKSHCDDSVVSALKTVSVTFREVYIEETSHFPFHFPPRFSFCFVILKNGKCDLSRGVYRGVQSFPPFICHLTFPFVLSF